MPNIDAFSWVVIDTLADEAGRVDDRRRSVHRLAVRIRGHVTAPDTETATSRRERDERIAQAFAHGVPAAERRETIVARECHPLVLYLARRYGGRGEALEDLVQVAADRAPAGDDRFDPERGVQFSTFAAATIVGELKRHLRDKAWSVRVPRRLQEIALVVNRTLPDLQQSLGRSPSFAEIAEAIGESESDVIEAVDAAQAFTASSLDGEPTTMRRRPSETLGEIDERFEIATGWADVAPGDPGAAGARATDPVPALLREQHAIRDRGGDRHLADARLTHPHRRPSPSCAAPSPTRLTLRRLVSPRRLSGRTAP